MSIQLFCPLRLPALVAISLLAACSSHPAQGTGGAAGSGSSAGSAGSGSQIAPAPKPASTLDQVTRSAPDAKVAPAGVAVPGIDLFLVSDGKPAPEDEGLPPRVVGVSGGPGGALLEGRDLVRAVIERSEMGGGDPAGSAGGAGGKAPRGIEARADRKVIAQVALWVAQDDGAILDRAKTPAQRKAKVGPPAVTGHTLGFWVLTTDPPPQVEHGQLDLSNGLLELQPLPVPQKVAIDRAMITLGSPAVSRHAAAIRTLAAACEDSRARQALLGALAGHPRVKARAEIADEAHRCGPAAVDALVSAMERDHSALVRRQAAAALGRIGDARARPALAKASRGEDANLAWTAGNALKKLR
ncbi:MAG TPA: HEAT repeat domain-containing protein [Kofleriaceae bacterium]|jgi:hypothetical protein|nr:HEAT repeat domain-containing protein [Kofleriaceae bacterium]